MSRATMLGVGAKRRGVSAKTRLAAFVDSSADAVTGMTLEGVVTHWNPSAERIFGYTAAEMIGQPITVIATAERSDEVFANLRRVARGERIEHLEAVRRRKDGTLVDVVLTVSPVRDASGEIVGAATIARDVTEPRAAARRRAAEAEREARFDALTGLPNRASFVRKLREQIRESTEWGTTFAILYADLDRFGEINDAFGHEGGDGVLRDLGARIVACGPETVARVARLEMDTFAFLLPAGSDVGQAVRAAEEGIEFLREPFALHEQRVHVSASIGIAAFPAHGMSAEDLLRHGETAMVASKRAQTRYAVYGSALDVQSAGKIALLQDLRRALAANELTVHYQPQVDFRTGRLVGAEALVRWPHPERGLIPPLEFIPLAEETGLIHQLTPWVLKRALAQQRAWQRAGLQLRISVNVSMRNLSDPEFPALVDALVATSGVDATSMTLEITEGAMMFDPTRTIDVLHGIRALGVNLSVDDFGTGYSSLAFLSRLPVNEVKIDRGFVIDVLTPGPRAIVQAVIDLGRAFGIRVIAEGVQDEDTWDQLYALGCDVAQGYHLSPALPPDDFASWASEHARSASVALDEGVDTRFGASAPGVLDLPPGQTPLALDEVGLVDPRTRLATKAVLRDHLGRSLVLAARDERWVGVLWLSIERLTLVGIDGERVADEVLRQCALRVQSAIRKSDLASSFDANTIVVALTAMAAPFHASAVAARVLLTLARPLVVEGRERSVRASSGVITTSDRSISIDALLRRARAAAEEAVDSEAPLRIDWGP
jgi:PAS domain S-box-containing protein/diguanylate cyclase (GGDEF)-like protein